MTGYDQGSREWLDEKCQLNLSTNLSTNYKLGRVTQMSKGDPRLGAGGILSHFIPRTILRESHELEHSPHPRR